MISTDKCPNCGKKIEKIPGRTINCVFCNKKIYVRTMVKDQKKVLADLEGVKKIDDDWVKYALQSNWFKILKKDFGITEKDYLSAHDELTKRFGFFPRHRDIFWSIFNNLVIEAIKEGNNKKGKLLQEYMEKFKSEEKRFGGTE